MLKKIALFLLVLLLAISVQQGKGKASEFSLIKENYLAYLSKPNTPGPFPVIIMSHGGGGIQPFYQAWVDQFVGWGFAIIYIDHYGPRGSRPSYSDAINMRRDDLISVLLAAKSIKSLDISRLTLAGWSIGGSLVLHGLLDDDVRKKAGIANLFKTAVLIYPFKGACRKFSASPLKLPIIILYGSEEPGLDLCWKHFASKLQNSDHPQVFKIYQGAHHVFDNPRITNKRCKQSGSAPLCFLYDESAHKKSISDLKSFLTKYAE